jgi:hypothetical protein
MRISEKFDKSGYFWLPSKPDERLPGTLRISESGEAELEVLGVFVDHVAAINDEPKIERINGLIEDGKLVTLDKCFYRKRSISFGGISKSIVYVKFVFVGVQYEDGEEIKFSSFRFSVEGLDEWLSISGIKVEHDFETKSASIIFQPPEKIRIKLTEDIDLLFTFGWTIPFLSNITEAKITQKAYITLTSNKLLPLQTFISLAFKLNNFLCFAIDQTVSIDSIIAFSYELKQKIKDNKEYEVPIEVYYPSLPFSGTVPKVQWHRMLFRYGHVAERIQDILVKWLDAYERIEPAFNLYFASKSGAHEYIDEKFLSLAQGIEAFHRRTSDETVMPDTKFNDIVQTLITACPEEKRKWLEDELKYSNELSLRIRLRQLMDPFESFFRSSKGRKALINKIVNTRNYLTHYDKSLEKEACNGSQLLELCMRMECLFQLHFLKEIGFSEQQINMIIEQNDQFRQKLKISNSGMDSDD